MTIIKNCGLRRVDELHAAAASGARFAGFVHYAPSPRHLPLEAMAVLVQATPTSLQSVAVLVNPDDAQLDAIVREVKPDYLQLHKVTRERAAEIGQRCGLPLILGVAVRSAADLAMAALLEPLAEHILLDSQESGSGQSFDWELLSQHRLTKPWFLAGGLHAQNVAAAIHSTGAPMVDVSSGIETAPGVKSLEKIAAFNRAVLHATHG